MNIKYWFTVQSIFAAVNEVNVLKSVKVLPAGAVTCVLLEALIAKCLWNALLFEFVNPGVIKPNCCAPAIAIELLAYSLQVKEDAVPVLVTRHVTRIISPTANVLAGINWLAVICSVATPVIAVPSVVLL